MLLSLVLTACAGHPIDHPKLTVARTDTLDHIVFADVGGCDDRPPGRLGCARYTLRPSGAFTLVTTGAQPLRGTLPPGVVKPLFDVGQSLDFNALLAALKPGKCHACTDGIDDVVEFHFGKQTFVLNSETHAFDNDYGVFALSAGVETLLRAAPTTP